MMSTWILLSAREARELHTNCQSQCKMSNTSQANIQNYFYCYHFIIIDPSEGPTEHTFYVNQK